MFQFGVPRENLLHNVSSQNSKFRRIYLPNTNISNAITFFFCKLFITFPKKLRCCIIRYVPKKETHTWLNCLHTFSKSLLKPGVWIFLFCCCFVFSFFSFITLLKPREHSVGGKWLCNSPGSHHLFRSQLILALQYNIQSPSSQSFAKSGVFFWCK